MTDTIQARRKAISLCRMLFCIILVKADIRSVVIRACGVSSATVCSNIAFATLRAL